MSSLKAKQNNLTRIISTSLLQALHTNKDLIDEDKELYHFYKMEQLIFLNILLVFIVLGNVLVLITLSINKQRKPRMNFFIRHLAYSDLLVGLVSVSADITWKITLSFNGGNLLCKFVKYSQQLVIYASTYVLVMLSLDRYDAVINPLNFNTRTSRIKRMVIFAWILSAFFSSPAIFLNKIQIKNNLPQCWIELNKFEWRLYFTLISMSLFFIPTLIIAYCYVFIVRTIWLKKQTDLEQTISNQYVNQFEKLNQQNNLIENLNQFKNQPIQNDSKAKNSTKKNTLKWLKRSSSNQFIFNQNLKKNFIHNHQSSLFNPSNLNQIESALNLSENRMRINSNFIISRAKIKTLQMTFVIITVFILCWSPYMIWDLLQVYGYIKRSAATNAISTFIQSLAPLNSAANPLIFCIFSMKEVKQTLNKIWRKVLCKKTKKSNFSNVKNDSNIMKKNLSTTTSTSSCKTKSVLLSRSKSTEN